MGEVYRARDTRLDRDVAVKILPADSVADAQLRQRFEREAKTISQLNHPNICTLYDVGQENGTHFLVMELLEGQTLAERIARGPLPLADVVTYGAQIADALDRAHREGVVHRDLKPANVMITRGGAKLLDFGLAKPWSVLGARSAVDETAKRSLTAEGTIIGTFQYMAPEQLEGLDADARTDIFAFGALLYEMATGRHAFDGKTKTSLIAAIVAAQPQPMSALQPLTPPAFEHVVAGCLEKDPEARWQSAHDIAQELRWIRDAGESDGPPKRSGSSVREWIAWTLAIAAIAAASSFAWRDYERGRDVAPVIAAIAAPDARTFDFDLGGSGSLTISPDGRYVTFAAVGANGRPSLWIRALDSSRVVEVPETGGEDFPFWSPDSRSLAYFSGGKLKRTDVNGSAPVIICDAPLGRSGDWNRDGVIIFSPTSTGPIHRVNATGGRSVPVTALDASRRESTHRWARFLPDGRHFLYMAGTHASSRMSDTNAIYAASLDGGARKLVLQARSNVAYASGHLLYLRDRSLVAQPFDARTLMLSGEARTIADPARYEPAYFRCVFAVSNDGKLVYEPGANGNLATLTWFDPNGTVLGHSGEAAEYHAVALSPDDATAAVSIGNSATGTTDIWLHDFTRGINQRFTFGPGDEEWPVWSPDGRRIAFSDSRSNSQAVYVKPLDGSEPERAIADNPGFDAEPADWSHDGRSVIATRHASGQNRAGQSNTADIVIIPVSGTGPLTRFGSAAFSQQAGPLSPDGQWLAFTSNESGRYEVFVARFPSAAAKQQVSTEGARFIGGWRGDDLIYLSADGKVVVVTLTPAGDRFSIGEPKAVPIDAVPSSLAHRSQRILQAVAPRARQDIALVMDWPALLRR